VLFFQARKSTSEKWRHILAVPSPVASHSETPWRRLRSSSQLARHWNAARSSNRTITSLVRSLPHLGAPWSDGRRLSAPWLTGKISNRNRIVALKVYTASYGPTDRLHGSKNYSQYETRSVTCRLSRDIDISPLLFCRLNCESTVSRRRILGAKIARWRGDGVTWSGVGGYRSLVSHIDRQTIFSGQLSFDRHTTRAN